MAREELGTKRQCQSCGAKFYDLNRDPILCPKCGTRFVVMAAVASKARAVVEDVPAARVVEDEDALLATGADFVSLEDIEADPSKDIGDPDIDLDTDDDDTFLPTEDEDDNDDVSDLIDGDLSDDDEN